MSERLPLGTMPRSTWLTLRAQDLTRAIGAYVAEAANEPAHAMHHLDLCRAWADELGVVINDLRDERARHA